MYKNPYEIIGISNDASMEAITEKFNVKKCELNQVVLSEGQVGTDAAVKLQELKEAYQEIIDMKSANASLDDDNVKRPLGRIEELIKSNQLVPAQKMLDMQVERGAEWHYLQSALYYKQGWIMESKAQLELAKQLAPNEEKYIKAYKSLLNVVTYGHPNGPVVDQTDPLRSYPPNTKSANVDDSCCNICGAILCADCCCDCLNR